MATNDIYSLSDLLRYETTSIENFGVENVQRTIERALAYTREEVSNMMGLLAEESTQARRLWGASSTGTAEEIMDDLGQAQSKVDAPGVEVDFPLRRFSETLGKSWLWEASATPADIARAFMGVQKRFLQRHIDEIKFALFNDDNYTFKDFLIDNTSLSVKAFLNADSAAIPAAPDGTTFTAASHKHYVGTAGAALAYTDIDTLISNVREHGLRGLALFVNAADVSVLAGLASTKFVAVDHAVIAVPGRTSGTIALDDPANYDLNDRLAGYWDGVPVYTKPWVPDNYVACIALGAEEKPLVYRVHPQASLRGMIEQPRTQVGQVISNGYDWLFGVAPWNRAAAAFLDTAHQTNYTEPTLIR